MKRPSYLHLQLYGLQPRERSRLLADDVADPRRAKGMSRWRALAREQFRALIELSSTQERPGVRVDTMLKEISRTRLVGFWFAVVAVIIAWVVATGVNIAIGTAALLTMCLVPPAIMLLVWRGAPPPTGWGTAVFREQ